MGFIYSIRRLFVFIRFDFGAIMFISEEELNRRLNSEKNLAQRFCPQVFPIPASESPKQEGQETPENLKVLGSSLIKQGVPERTVCKEFNINPSDIRSADEQRVTSSLDRVRELALDRLLIGLKLMTPDKFADANFKDVSNAVANLSRVVEKTSPRESLNVGVQFIVHTPPQKSLGSYQVVDV